jgi:hypothetical protein
LQELVHQFQAVAVSADEWLEGTDVNKHGEVEEVDAQHLEDGLVYENNGDKDEEASTDDEDEVVSDVAFSF